MSKLPIDIDKFLRDNVYNHGDWLAQLLEKFGVLLLGEEMQGHICTNCDNPAVYCDDCMNVARARIEELEQAYDRCDKAFEEAELARMSIKDNYEELEEEFDKLQSELARLKSSREIVLGEAVKELEAFLRIT